MAASGAVLIASFYPGDSVKGAEGRLGSGCGSPEKPVMADLVGRVHPSRFYRGRTRQRLRRLCPGIWTSASVKSRFLPKKAPS